MTHIILACCLSITPVAHVRNTFQVRVKAPIKIAGPLFGPEAERAWAEGQWNPVFLYPPTPEDIPGAVFTVEHGPHTSVWVNTAFDLDKGHIQYVYVIADVMITTIDITLTPVGPSETLATVVYERTALKSEANAHVIAMGKADGENGKQWEDAINKYLGH